MLILTRVIHTVERQSGDDVVVDETGHLEKVVHLVLLLSHSVLLYFEDYKHFFPKEIVQAEKHDSAN